MSLPISKDSTAGLILSALFGIIFGFLLNKGRVTQYNVIVNLFRLKDFTVMKIMLTAIVVGGVGVFAMKGMGLIEAYQVKSANLLGVALGSAIFGVGMALLGYCPGTGVAAMAAGRIHAVVGFLGMLAGGIVYAFSYGWVNENILSVAAMGKVRLPEVTGIPAIAWWAILFVGVGVVFYLLEKKFTTSEGES
ncbi:MAG: YeeE/YedE thiosulfate transporter family protein [Verrucomicrobiales bacterium]|nr:YeeE/YedE thiosulfate transporter family protein [Verrucomicrobiales bacterium]